MTGRITRLVTDKGYGFIRATDNGLEYFFVRTEVVNVLFANLYAGQQVTSFIEEKSMRGPRAGRVVVDTSGGMNVSAQ